MKNIITTISFGVLIVFFAACKKDVTADNALNTNFITGTWELKKITGGFRGIYPGKNYSPGNGNTWTFSDFKYQSYSNHIPMQEGNYSLGKDSSHATGHITDYVLLSSNEKIYFEIKNNIMTLYMGELSYDGTIQEYERIATYQ